MQNIEVARRRDEVADLPPCPDCRHSYRVHTVGALTAGVSRPSLIDHILAGVDPSWKFRLAGLDHVVGDPRPTPRLIKDLLPPRAPLDYGQLVDARLTAMVNLAFLSLTLLLTGLALDIGAGIRVAVCLFVGLLLYTGWFVTMVATGQLRRSAADRWERDHRARQRWRALFYCDDCGGVFVIGWSSCIPPDSVHAYVVGQLEVGKRRGASTNAK